MRALRITAIGRTRFVQIEVPAGDEPALGTSMPLGDDHVIILNAAGTGSGHPNRLATATAVHLGMETTEVDVIRGSVLIVRRDAAGRWRDADDAIEQEIHGLAALLRY